MKRLTEQRAQELMEAIQVLAPNLYEATLDKLNNI